MLTKKDKTDKENISLSDSIHSPVDNNHKIEFSLENGAKALLSLPRDIQPNEIKTIKAILDSLIAKE